MVIVTLLVLHGRDTEGLSCNLQVSAYRVLSSQGPQPYALAVLGAYSGVLASAANPAYSGNAAQAACQVVVAQITAGPSGLTNASYDPCHGSDYQGP